MFLWHITPCFYIWLCHALWLINCVLAVRHGDVFLKVFTSLFSKSDRRSNARSVGRSSQRAKFLYPSKAPPKGECRASARQRGTTQVGGSPFSTKLFLNRLSAFLLLPLAQKKSLAKENAVVYFASAEATNAPRVGSAVAF